MHKHLARSTHGRLFTVKENGAWKSFSSTIFFSCLAAFLAFFLSFHGQEQAEAQDASSSFANLHRCRAIIIVRHADRDGEGLSPAGFTRSHDLADTLQNAGVTKIFVTDTLQTQQTARPLQDLLGSKTTSKTNDYNNNGNDLAAYVNRNVTNDDVALIVYHHDSARLPLLLRTILDQRKSYENENFNEDTYDKIFILVPDSNSNKFNIFRGRYGTLCKGTSYPIVTNVDRKFIDKVRQGTITSKN